MAVGKEAGKVIDEDEEEDGAYNRALRDAMGKRKCRCGTSADELGAAGKVTAEPGGGDAGDRLRPGVLYKTFIYLVWYPLHLSA